MSMWAIVPVKPLRNGKSRLSGVLSDEARIELNISLLGHTLEVLSQVDEIDNILVVSRDQTVLSIAHEMGAVTIMEDGTAQLNPALQMATNVANLNNPQSVLILPADLPLLQPVDVKYINSKAVNPPVVVIAPDRHRSGTNALLLRPLGLIEYSFGPDSFQKHCEKALAAEARVEICKIPSVELDLDLPEDLELLNSMNVEIPSIQIRS